MKPLRTSRRTWPERRAGRHELVRSGQVAGRPPVSLVAGFLGSGKITPLDRLLRLPGWPGADRRSRIVSITRGVDRAGIEASLPGTLAPAA